MKIVLFGNEARKKILKGVNLISDSIKVTLGPRGRNVLYGFHYGFPVLTKDGVTVSKQVECKDPTEQLGLLLIRQVAQKTADEAGDGTTTAAVLAQAIFNEGLKALATNANPILIKKGIDLAVKEALSFISKQVIKDPTEDDILRVATVSANNDSAIAEIVCQAIKKAGKNGVITIEDNYRDSSTYIETVEGMQLNEGWISPYFATEPVKMEAVYKNPYILIADYEIGHIQPLMKAVELAIGQEKRPLVIIANNVTGQALQTLVVNKMKQGVPILACKAPYFGDNRTEQLTDLAILTGGRVVGNASGLKFEDIELSDFGQAESIVATKHYTTITGGKGDNVNTEARIKLLQSQIDKSESDYEKEKLQERLAKLTSGVAVIKVGASTEVECKEKKFRIEDALCASRSALEEGIIAGGGIALLRASKYLDSLPNLLEEEGIGRKIVIKALQEPIKCIASNAGLDGSEVIAKILMQPEPTVTSSSNVEWSNISSFNYGYDFLNNKYGDMFEMGIIDPYKVVRLTLENAASVSGSLLTTEASISETIEDEVFKTPIPKSE